MVGFPRFGAVDGGSLTTTWPQVSWLGQTIGPIIRLPAKGRRAAMSAAGLHVRASCLWLASGGPAAARPGRARSGIPMETPRLMMTDDAVLLERIRRNEPGAFEALVDRFGGHILGFGLRVCGEREDAKDILQETLLAAFRSLRGLEDPSALRSWLYRVATNACLMKRRKGKFEPEREIPLEELGPLGPSGVTAEIPDPSDLPDEALRRSEVAARVQEAIASLPPHYRVVLVLRDMEGLSTGEVAGALGLAVSAVKMRLHRARLMVRRYLETGIAQIGGDTESET